SHAKKRAQIEAERGRLESHVIAPGPEVDRALETLGSAPLGGRRPASELLKRPELDYAHLAMLGYSPDPDLPMEVVEEVMLELKYEGYIRKQARHLEDFRRME